jgi:hypothetical protein
VLTDAAIGAVFTVALHATATKIKELVALGKQGGVPALKARLAEFTAERRAFGQNERGSIGLPSKGLVDPTRNLVEESGLFRNVHPEDLPEAFVRIVPEVAAARSGLSYSVARKVEWVWCLMSGWLSARAVVRRSGQGWGQPSWVPAQMMSWVAT